MKCEKCIETWKTAGLYIENYQEEGGGLNKTVFLHLSCLVSIYGKKRGEGGQKEQLIDTYEQI